MVVTVAAPLAGVPVVDNVPVTTEVPVDPAPASVAATDKDELATTGASASVLAITAVLVLLGGLATVLTVARRKQQH